MNAVTWKQHDANGLSSNFGHYMTGKVGGLELRVKPQSDGAYYWDVNDGTNLIRFGKARDRIHAMEWAESVIGYMTAQPESQKMTKWELFSLLACKGTPTVDIGDSKTAIVQSVQRESGSGKSFIVHLLLEHSLHTTLYVKTTD